jgi:phage terminase large subunit-like protein
MNLLEPYKPLFDLDRSHRYTLITGGRGSAKSYHVATFLLNLTYSPNHVILFTRWTLTSAHISIIPEFIEKIELLNKVEDFEVKQTEIVNKHTGSRILFRGIKTSQGTATANLKSIQGVTTWVLDEAEELTDQDVFDRIDLSIRSTKQRNRVILVMNPAFKTHFIYKRFIEQSRSDTLHIHTTYRQNKMHLSASFLEAAQRMRQRNEIRYKHLFLGDWLEEAEGLLWNSAMIARLRITAPPNLRRVVVAIDPATTSTKNSDETGITVQGIDNAGNGYLLEDCSGTYTPQQWATVANSARLRWDADCYVAEGNQGGEMVEAVLRQIDKATRIKRVNATKGKYTRAEPIYSLYEQSRIYHVGEFPRLESQMVTFNPDAGGASPDRVDALVWGFTELMLRKTISYQIG